jgi:hypothetical protein
MVKRHVCIATALMIFVAATTSFAQDKYQWKLEDTDEGCQIYTSKVAGKDYIAAKTSCVIPARIEVVGMVLRDIEAFPQWMSDCKETKILKVVSDADDVFIFWFRQHVMLLTDRDMVLKSTREMKPGYGFITANSTNEVAYDVDKGYVRMPSFFSEYTLEWVDREHTKVTFMIDPDLARGIPKGIANSTIKKIPFKSLQGMKKMVKLQKYIDSAKTSVYAKLAEDGMKDGTLKP